MKKILHQLKHIYFDEENSIKKRMVFASFFVLSGLAIISWFLIRLFCYEKHWNISHNINLPVVGLIGDFIGGFAGTFFTLVGVLLLFETLALQRKELAESRKVFEKQQFENSFYNLLKLYQEISKTLQIETLTKHGSKIHHGKDFWEEQRKLFYSGFQSKNKATKNRRPSKINYTIFYVENKEQVAHYFRTIYRIFSFINVSNLSSKEKMNYAKIIRAQLSESELFFLYYNSLSEYGTKFRRLINTFNILKHLPILEKVEFKSYVEGLGQMEKNSINLALENLLELIIKSNLIQNKIYSKSYLGGALTFKVKSKDSSSFEITIIKRNDIIFSEKHQQGLGFSKFTTEQTELFIKEFLDDVINYSNYYEFNERNVVMDSNVTKTDNKNIIEIKLYNRISKPIKIQ